MMNSNFGEPLVGNEGKLHSLVELNLYDQIIRSPEEPEADCNEILPHSISPLACGWMDSQPGMSSSGDYVAQLSEFDSVYEQVSQSQHPWTESTHSDVGSNIPRRRTEEFLVPSSTVSESVAPIYVQGPLSSYEWVDQGDAQLIAFAAQNSMEDEDKENVAQSPAAFVEIEMNSVKESVIEDTTDVHLATKMVVLPAETVADASETAQHSAIVSINGTANLKPNPLPKRTGQMPDLVFRPGPSGHNSRVAGKSISSATTSSSTLAVYRTQRNKNLIPNIVQLVKDCFKGQRGNNPPVLPHNPPKLVFSHISLIDY